MRGGLRLQSRKLCGSLWMHTDGRREVRYLAGHGPDRVIRIIHSELRAQSPPNTAERTM